MLCNKIGTSPTWRDVRFELLGAQWRTSTKLDDGEVRSDQSAALKKLFAGCTKLHKLSSTIMRPSLKATRELYAENAAVNLNFKKVLESTNAFTSIGYQWFQVAELRYDSFMACKPQGQTFKAGQARSLMAGTRPDKQNPDRKLRAFNGSQMAASPAVRRG